MALVKKLKSEKKQGGLAGVYWKYWGLEKNNVQSFQEEIDVWVEPCTLGSTDLKVGS